MSELRPYQVMAIDSALAALSNSGSAVLQMPTGAGKTRAATEIIKRWDGVVWFICHRQEIERQASSAFTAAGIDHGVISPRGAPEYGKRVQVVSVATLARRIGDLPPPALVIWDECHHVAAKSWSAIREQLSDAKHLGLTATPERLDGKGLAGWFAELVVGPSTRELIDGEWLSDFRYFAPSEPDLTGAKLRAGDYRKEDVAKATNVPVLIGDAIAEYRAKADGKRAIVFCAGVEASRMLVERFNEKGIPARHIDGTTPTNERDNAVAQLASGSIKVLSNVDVFTEGFDLPAIDAVILLRPTKSLALFLQMVGRVLRCAEGKSEALIFDHAGLWLDHDWFDLPITWSLDGGARKRRLAGRAHGPRRCPECKEVRAERAPACDCGYEFPTGREIGEYDGELREVWSDWHAARNPPEDVTDPESWGTVIALAEMCGLSAGARDTIRSIPGVRIASNGWAHLPTGVEAVRKYYKSPHCPPMEVDDPDKYEPKNHFAKRIGRSAKVIDRWALDPEFPRAMNGWVHIERGLVWADEVKDKESRAKRYRTGTAEDYAVLRAASARYRITLGAIKPWFSAGMPADGILHGDFSAADKWVLNHRFRNAPPLDVSDPENYEKAETFAKMVGASSGKVVDGWGRQGMPRATNGWVHVATCSKWVENNWRPVNRPPRDVHDPWAYCSSVAFGQMIGKHHCTIIEWRSRGLPCASNGWVHIQRGLEWVRDNTSIVIPPEAWPSANDNDAAGDSAAA